VNVLAIGAEVARLHKAKAILNSIEIPVEVKRGRPSLPHQIRQPASSLASRRLSDEAGGKIAG